MSDTWIRDMSLKHGMIEPFTDKQVREGTISYGVSSYGYDARCANEFKIFTNVDSAIVDPKNFANEGFVSRETDVCIIPPNSFVLARTVEYFRIPKDVLVICLGKSTYARCGIIGVNKNQAPLFCNLASSLIQCKGNFLQLSVNLLAYKTLGNDLLP